MLFNSLAFLVFFPLVVALYFATPQRQRWILLLIASYIFYAWWKVGYLALIIASTLVDYGAGLMMGRFDTRRKRRPWLILSLCTNLGLLLTFKYFNFFSASLGAVFNGLGLPYESFYLNVLLPVGISFYTFQTLAYSIDVYRGRQQPERHLGIFALYVAFFPQLVAGPIERSQNLLPQFRQPHAFDYERVRSGLMLMLWGFFKKLIIADRLALYVDGVYNHPDQATGSTFVIATYFFAFQIYCDFSGYSDIAIGTAKVMGYDLMENFRRPYFSKSIGEFWRRWHISLSTWFRDYLYFPLGGNRVSKVRWYTNLLIVFVVSGLWHGAAWTFVVWGLLHGLYLISGEFTRPLRDRIWTALQDYGKSATFPAAGFLVRKTLAIRNGIDLFLTFHLILIAWVFFRANSLSDVLTLSNVLFSGNLALTPVGDFGQTHWAIALTGISLLLGVHLLQRHCRLRTRIASFPIGVRWSIYLATVIFIFSFGEFGAEAFIYFQF